MLMIERKHKRSDESKEDGRPTKKVLVPYEESPKAYPMVVAAPPTPMNTISWNCRGLGRPCVVQELTKMVKKILSHNSLSHGNKIKR